MAATKKATKKTTAKKAAPAKAKSAPKKAKTTRKVSTSPKAVAARRNFKAAQELAVQAIYEAGKKGRSCPTWGQALRAAYRGENLSGTAKR